MRVVDFYYNDDLIKKISIATSQYEKICNRSFLYMSISAKAQELYMFQTLYQPRHFMHLCGIKSTTKTAEEFFKSCLSKKVSIRDCSPSEGHSRTDICKKVSVLSDLINIKNTKMYRTGEKDSIYGGIDFDFAVGDSCFIGYKYDNKIKMCFPYSNMIAPIGAYCTDINRISVVLSKEMDAEYYSKIEFEASKNLLQKVGDDIKNALSPFVIGDILGRDDIQKEQERLFGITKEDVDEREK